MTSTPPEHPVGPTILLPPQWPDDLDGFQPSHHRQRRKSRQYSVSDIESDAKSLSDTASPPTSFNSPRLVPSASISSPIPRTPPTSSSSSGLSKTRPSPKLSTSSSLPATTANAFALLDSSNAQRYKTTIEDGSPNTSPRVSPTTARRKRKSKAGHPTPPGTPLTVSPSTSTSSIVVTPVMRATGSLPPTPVSPSFSYNTEASAPTGSDAKTDNKLNRHTSVDSFHPIEHSLPITSLSSLSTDQLVPPISPESHELTTVLERPEEESEDVPSVSFITAPETDTTTTLSTQEPISTMRLSTSAPNTARYRSYPIPASADASPNSSAPPSLHVQRRPSPSDPPTALPYVNPDLDSTTAETQKTVPIPPPKPVTETEIPPPTISAANIKPVTPLMAAQHTEIPTFTIWDYLRDELMASDFDAQQELKRERVTNFLGVPAAIEKLLLFGYFVCLDSFLYTFTILPMRFTIALFYLSRNTARDANAWWKGRAERRYVEGFSRASMASMTRSPPTPAYVALAPDLNRLSSQLKSSQKCDLLKGILVLVTCLAMGHVDTSRMYHSIRGQAVIKLYVIFNVLEICDRLCCSFGTDILDALFSKSTLGDQARDEDEDGSHHHKHLRPVTFFCLALGYMRILSYDNLVNSASQVTPGLSRIVVMFILDLIRLPYLLTHTMVLFFQMVTLNVAINFYSNALLTLLISNQFVEIKASVFKKFERENLFQLSCSDIVERFQQSIFLFLITVRNVIELSDSPPSPFSILPSTFVPLFKLPATTFDSLLTPVVMVIVSELVVDWLKHAFITKFNQIRPSVYEKYIDVLCKDLVVGSPGRAGGRKNTFVDQSPMVSRRIGFPALPLACVVSSNLPIPDRASPDCINPLIPLVLALYTSPREVIRIMVQTFYMIQPHSSPPTSSYPLEPMAFPTPDPATPTPGSMLEEIIVSIAQSGISGALVFEWINRWPVVFEWGRRIWSVLVWGGAFAIFGACLIAVKLVVGTNLLTFAYRRYATMQQRDESEAEKEKEMKRMGKEEKEYSTQLRTFLNDPRDSLLGVSPAKLTLENIERFSMYRSQIP
ncbi:eukaryotic membrane protein family-domain-containing protein [Jimgerdemannia flammicorona]|uniref:Eukaryotic membrane protein family-domain-containing protein n=1 Tax=Jimgerdemannia flammicorona TaxID=994334 RepID=A0A433DLG5_9FUNG|nr:eukaryotic membrane protein family-domain-containing protein [Jimgerdemannia flammicorona]